MKPDVHPVYGAVALRDRATGRLTPTRSTLAGSDIAETVEVDGSTYPVVDVDISSDTHAFWTGTAPTLDSEGRVEKLQRRYGAKS